MTASAGDAAAQAFRTTVTPAPRADLVPTRRAGAPETAPDDDAGFAAAPPLLPRTEGEAEEPNLADGNVDDSVPGDEALLAGGRPVLRDGDLTPPSPEQPVDGRIDLRGAVAPTDGVDSSRVDTRLPGDVAAFESPPAGFDPSVFQAEVEPLLDRRPRQLFRFEPYQPTGIRVGSFVLLPEIETGLAAFSNVFQSQNARSAIAYEVRPSARLVSNWRLHALEFSARGGLVGFREFDSENERSYAVEARGRLDISRRTNIEAFVGRELSQEARSSLDSTGLTGDRTNVTSQRAAVTFNHRFNRLSIQLRGSVGEQTYAAGLDALGAVVTNADRNNVVTEQAVRATWEFKPTLSVFSEIAINQRTYDAASGDGFLRDSKGQRARVGVSFGNTSQLLRGEISVGFGRQTPDAAGLADIAGVIVDANVAWRMNSATTLLLTARSDVLDSTQAGSAGALSREAGVEVRHELRRNLIVNAGLGYAVQDYSGIDLQERVLTATAGVEYFLNRNASVFGRYRHIAFDSTDPLRGYDADEVRIGLRLRR